MKKVLERNIQAMRQRIVAKTEASRQLSQPELFGGGTPSRAIVHGAGGVGMQNNCVFTLEV